MIISLNISKRCFLFLLLDNPPWGKAQNPCLILFIRFYLIGMYICITCNFFKQCKSNILMTQILCFQEKSGLIFLFTVCLIFMFFFHLIAAIVITLWGVEESPVLIKELRDVFLDLVYGWDVDPRKSRILRQIQEYVSYRQFK